jgi:hypothetical protein
MKRDLEVHVETLVVEGVNQVEAVSVGQAFQHELARLLERSNESPLLNDSQATARLKDASVRFSPASSSVDLGTSVARAVHGRLVP